MIRICSCCCHDSSYQQQQCTMTLKVASSWSQMKSTVFIKLFPWAHHLSCLQCCILLVILCWSMTQPMSWLMEILDVHHTKYQARFSHMWNRCIPDGASHFQLISNYKYHNGVLVWWKRARWHSMLSQSNLSHFGVPQIHGKHDLIVSENLGKLWIQRHMSLERGRRTENSSCLYHIPSIHWFWWCRSKPVK